MRKIIYALCSFLVLSAPVATAEESVGELQKKCEAVKSLKGEIRAKAFLDCTIALAERLDFLNGQVAVLSAALPPNAVVAFAGECPATDQGWEPYEPGIGKFIIGAGDRPNGRGGELVQRKDGELVEGATTVRLTPHKIGDQGGSEDVSLSEDQIPAHTHPLGGIFDGAPLGWIKVLNTTFSNTGDHSSVLAIAGADGSSEDNCNGDRCRQTGSQRSKDIVSAPHQNMPPYIALTWCKRVQ